MYNNAVELSKSSVNHGSVVDLLTDGWLLINKARGVSSASLVSRVKYLIKETLPLSKKSEKNDDFSLLLHSNDQFNNALVTKNVNAKVGHCGTLDVEAEGLMVIALGKATKLASYVQNNDKTYVFSIKWGENREGGDAEGGIISQSSFIPTAQDIENHLTPLIGEQLQIPPSYSAISIGGKRAYQLARQKIDFTILPRKVHAYKLKLMDHDQNNGLSTLILSCSKGFYVRSLIGDLAKACGAYGYAARIFRTEIGNFSVDNAIYIDMPIYSDVEKLHIKNKKKYYRPQTKEISSNFAQNDPSQVCDNAHIISAAEEQNKKMLKNDEDHGFLDVAITTNILKKKILDAIIPIEEIFSMKNQNFRGLWPYKYTIADQNELKRVSNGCNIEIAVSQLSDFGKSDILKQDEYILPHDRVVQDCVAHDVGVGQEIVIFSCNKLIAIYSCYNFQNSTCFLKANKVLISD